MGGDNKAGRASTAGHRARDIAAMVRAGSISPVDVVRDHLDRIASLDHRVRAFRVVRAGAALAEAEALAARPDLTSLPLAGVPVAIKDDTDVAGESTRQGSAATSDVPAAGDDPLVAALRDAGCVVIGKTNAPELQIWGFTESATFGSTATPHDLGRNAGGSSGGSAAAVAAGFVPLALGSDGGGSIRIPSAYCGVTGLKPGRPPDADMTGRRWFGLSVSGPIAADAADTWLMYGVLTGGKGTAGGTGVPGLLRVTVSLRSPSPLFRADDHARTAVERARNRLVAAGHLATDGDPSYPPSLPLVFAAAWSAGVAYQAAGLPADLLEPRTRALIRAGRAVRRLGGPSPSGFDRWAAAAASFFEGVEVLLTPTVVRPSPRVGTMTGRGFTRTLVMSARAVPFMQAWNIAGFPAMTVPVGMDGTRPLTVQLIGRPGSEDLLLRLAGTIEEPVAPDL